MKKQYKCTKCNITDKELDFDDWCSNCKDLTRVEIEPTKKDYTHDFIFSKYLEDECPVCDAKVDSDSFYSHTENGGKCMAKYFRCENCGSEYTVGYKRTRQPIASEITFNGIF